MIDVLIPVLGRPGNAAPVAESLARSTTVPYHAVFLASLTDVDEIAACVATGVRVAVVPWEPGPGDFARKVNHGFRITSASFVFQAADDVEFQPGWDVEALRVIEETDTGVCGTQDDANPRVKRGQHATHSLIRRSYVDECGASLDGPGSVFSEAYSHQWVDSELVELAKARGCWSFAERSVVTHRHPIWGTAETDETYRKGQADAAADRRLYNERSRRFAE